jgi:hypothetical protein
MDSAPYYGVDCKGDRNWYKRSCTMKGLQFVLAQEGTIKRHVYQLYDKTFVENIKFVFSCCVFP